MDSARIYREAVEERARWGRKIGVADEASSAFLTESVVTPQGWMNNGIIEDISLQTLPGLWPPGGMAGMLT